MLSKRFLIISALAMGQTMAAVAAVADTPLSAIDWLSDSIETPVVLQSQPDLDTDVSNDASVEDITVSTLGGPTPDAVGLLPVSVTGLPRTFWGASPSLDLARLIRNQPAHNLPALQDLLKMILLAELDAPVDADGTGALFLARIDKLLDIGMLDQAQALLERAGPHSPDLFRRWFDVALLTGTEDKACKSLRSNAEIAPTYSARIFCLARNGDWNAAAVTLETAKVLGYVSKQEDALLVRFLDPELFEGAAPLPPPKHLTPLIFRMREAIGEAIPTANLPRAFANADLRSNTGWKPQIEAAERLAKTGAIDENRLLGLYTERLPAASGGIWERVDAVQAFDRAYQTKDPSALAKALPKVWDLIANAELEVSFAALYGEGLDKLPLGTQTAPLAYQVGLLSEGYEKIAGGYAPVSKTEVFLTALAKGDLRNIKAPNPTARTIKAAFETVGIPPQFTPLIRAEKLGEAVLQAIILFSQGTNGDLDDLRKALILLRSVGLEDTARRAALQLMLLDRRG